MSFFPSPLFPPLSFPPSPFNMSEMVLLLCRALWFHADRKQTSVNLAWLKHAQSSAIIINSFLTFIQPQQNWLNDTWATSFCIKALCCVLFSFRYYFKVQAKNVFGLGPISDTLTYVTESGVYPVNTGNNKLGDAPLTTVQPSVKSFCCTAARKH